MAHAAWHGTPIARASCGAEPRVTWHAAVCCARGVGRPTGAAAAPAEDEGGEEDPQAPADEYAQNPSLQVSHQPGLGASLAAAAAQQAASALMHARLPPLAQSRIHNGLAAILDRGRDAAHA